LKRDIRDNGQRVSIELWQGKIIDGRNRYRACRDVRVEPKCRVLQQLPAESPMSYVLSLNLHRRHLDTTQRAMVGARTRTFAGNAGRTPATQHSAEGCSRDSAGAAVNVSGKSIDFATRVLQLGHAEVIAACDRGELAISKAAQLVLLPQDEQRRALRGGKAAVAAAITSLRPLPKGHASDRFQNYLNQVRRIETICRYEYASPAALFADPNFDPASIDDCSAQLLELVDSLSRWAVELAEFLRDREAASQDHVSADRSLPPAAALGQPRRTRSAAG
jgi:hypothetical protein